MRVLITGAAGYLGAALAERLGDEHELTLADIRPREDGSGRWRAFDVTDLDAVRSCVRGHDAVVHTVALVRERAGATLRAHVDTMVLGTWNVAEACALEQVGRLVNVSSVVADGWTDDATRQRRVGDAPAFAERDRFYAVSKHVGEAIVRAYGQAFPIATLNLRPAVIAGDGLNPDPERPQDAGEGPYWFVHVDVQDVADGIARALASEATGTYQLVAGRADARWEWESAAQAFGYAPAHNWPEV
ncbi:MAG TPA: NAD(P)-dependent oxidoreductase [Conexibacter sp.]|nr:NAD(P)-dependent oxidoreductase [Conexibacter sp.]